MKHAFSFIFLLLVFPARLFCQVNPPQTVIQNTLKKLPNEDASGAIEITDSIFGPVNVSSGYGKIQELEEGQYSNMIEHSSAWFKFTMAVDTLLTFDIVPLDSLDDYDFTLLKCTRGDCAGNGPKKLQMIRQCYSVCYSKSGMTGISRYTGNMKIGPGDGPAYVSAVPVKAGEIYYLVVDNDVERNGRYADENGRLRTASKIPAGFTIYFYNYCPKRKPIVLNNIFFETNKSTLKSESFVELDSLVMRLKGSPMVIEISGHTDNVGSEKDNLQLSEERALAVKNYLVSKSISAARIYSKGYGSSRPVTSNKTEEGRKKNRRVEFVILLN